MFAAASFETTNPEATQSKGEQERKKRREKKDREDKMSFCKSRETTTGLCGVGPRPACPHRCQLVQGPGTVRDLWVSMPCTPGPPACGHR